MTIPEHAIALVDELLAVRRISSCEADFLRAALTLGRSVTFPPSESPRGLRERRLARGLTQRQLAALIGVRQITVHKLEVGKMKLTYDYCERLSVHLMAAPLEIYLSHKATVPSRVAMLPNEVA